MQKLHKTIRRKLLFVLFAFLCTSCSQDNGFTLFADESFFVRQGSGQCGPTSFYMIFKYYGDTHYQGVFTELPDCAINLPLQENLTLVTQESAVSKWLGVTDSGISIVALMDKISRLTADREHPYYTVEGDSDETDTEKKARLQYINQSFLEHDLPVIIHVSRPLFFSGHYMVLAGYDCEAKKIYYIDPNMDEDSPVIQCIKEEDFLENNWYRSPDNSTLVPNAYWDGTWIGFKHSN